MLRNNLLVSCTKMNDYTLLLLTFLQGFDCDRVLSEYMYMNYEMIQTLCCDICPMSANNYAICINYARQRINLDYHPIIWRIFFPNNIRREKTPMNGHIRKEGGRASP